jgi:hypothetical protein
MLQAVPGVAVVPPCNVCNTVIRAALRIMYRGK